MAYLLDAFEGLGMKLPASINEVMETYDPKELIGVDAICFNENLHKAVKKYLEKNNYLKIVSQFHGLYDYMENVVGVLFHVYDSNCVIHSIVVDEIRLHKIANCDDDIQVHLAQLDGRNVDMWRGLGETLTPSLNELLNYIYWKGKDIPVEEEREEITIYVDNGKLKLNGNWS